MLKSTRVRRKYDAMQYYCLLIKINFLQIKGKALK